MNKIMIHANYKTINHFLEKALSIGILNYNQNNPGIYFNNDESIYPNLTLENDKMDKNKNTVKINASTVLVVDDDGLSRELATKVLQRNEFKTIEAENGEKAIELYKKNKKEIDLVLVDIIMPGKSGLDVYNFIRKQQSNVPIVFVSGYASKDDINVVEHKEDYVFIKKPFEIY